MSEFIQHKIPDGIVRIRILDYLLKYVTLFSTRNGAKNAIKNGSLLLDGNKVETGRYVLPGQVITYAEVAKSVARFFELPLEVIFEDDYVAVINKPAGISVSGNYFRTIENALPFNLRTSTSVDKLLKPQPVHRLDNQTSGLLLIAKTHKARIDLGYQFESKKIMKKYQAIVIGSILDAGKIETHIEEKEACTQYQTVERVNSVKYGFLSRVELNPLTGRTHQLRIHLSGFGHPILGDKLYSGTFPLLKQKGLFLCATSLQFEHPVLKQMCFFEINPPPKFDKIMKRAEDQFYRAKTTTN